MISVEEARARILAPLRPTAAEIVPLASSWGRVTAAAIVARLDQPPADVSAMDGYAVRAGDAGPLRVVGAAPAGHPFDGAIGYGETVRLFTGSVVPQGADSVVLQEDVRRDGETVTPTEAAVAGAHIRRQGQDFAGGDVLIEAGTRLNARAVGLAAAGNHAWIAVHRRPVVAILATGDEIALPGDPISAGGIVSSNAHALAALVRAYGGTPRVLPIAVDRADVISEAAASSAGADILLTTGGASVGDHDLVQAALGRQGFELDFWKIAMRPGKPLIFGWLGATAVLGLPGNPVSALVCAVLFLGPALERLLGLPGGAPPRSRARLAVPLGANDQRADHLRATLEDVDGAIPVARPFPRQDSSMLRSLYRADALILRAPGASALPMGAEVDIIRLDRLDR